MEDRIKKIEYLLAEHEQRLCDLEKPVIGNLQQASSKMLSVKEFLLPKKPQNDVQRSLAIGYYIEKYGGAKSFNIMDLEEGFRNAKEPVPTNMNDKVNQNMRKGYMMLTKEKKDLRTTWCLTASGEKLVEEGFTSNAK